MYSVKKSIVSIPLVVCLAVYFVPSVSFASSVNFFSFMKQSEVDDSVDYKSENEGFDSVCFKVKNESKLPNYIDMTEFETNDYVSRLESEEDLNTYVFENADGSRSVYYLTEDVKYRNSEGEIIEKDISLVLGDNGYHMADNNIFLSIPYDLRDGIQIGEDDYRVSFTPIGYQNYEASISDNSVVYEQAFGTNVDLKYTPLLSGVKEDVILYDYIPNANFAFSFDSNGLGLFESEGEYYFAETVDSDVTFRFGKVIAYDQNMTPCLGDIMIEKEKEGNYQITISVDDDFLSDANTVYPVTIDPTITVSCGTVSGTKYIVDAPIFQGLPNQNFGGYSYNSLGTPDSTFGKGRTCIKTPGFVSYTAYSSISSDQIISTYFYIKDASGNPSRYIKLYPMTNTTWTESSVTWNSVYSSYNSSYDYGNILGNTTWASFNITPVVKKWKSGSLSSSAGFMLINSNENTMKSFFSSENTATASRPYIVFKYSVSTGTVPNENGQNKDSWCWAASSKRVGEHNGGSGALPTGSQILNYTDHLHSYAGIPFYGNNGYGSYLADSGQRYLVVSIYGLDMSFPGETSDVLVSLQRASSNTMNIGLKVHPTTTDLSFVKSELTSGRWLVASEHESGYIDGHTIVLTSYDSNSAIFGVWDPYDDRDFYITESSFVSNSFLLKTSNQTHSLDWCIYCN